MSMQGLIHWRRNCVSLSLLSKETIISFQNEAMTGTHTQNPIYSRITMALMEDTGWYMPNYELADELKWGAQLGKVLMLRHADLGYFESFYFCAENHKIVFSKNSYLTQ